MAEFNDNSVMPFGKYKGKKMIEIPADYLIWLHDQGCSNHQVKKYLNDNIDVLKTEVKRSKK